MHAQGDEEDSHFGGCCIQEGVPSHDDENVFPAELSHIVNRLQEHRKCTNREVAALLALFWQFLVILAQKWSYQHIFGIFF